jgi:hypothetical protein
MVAVCSRIPKSFLSLDIYRQLLSSEGARGVSNFLNRLKIRKGNRRGTDGTNVLLGVRGLDIWSFFLYWGKKK